MAIQIAVAQGEISGLDASAPWAQGEKEGPVEKNLLGLRPGHPVPQPVLVRITLVPFKPGNLGKELGNQTHVFSICCTYTAVKTSIGLVGRQPPDTKYAERNRVQLRGLSEAMPTSAATRSWAADEILWPRHDHASAVRS